jgi:hypothetical protein
MRLPRKTDSIKSLLRLLLEANTEIKAIVGSYFQKKGTPGTELGRIA